MWKVAAGSMSSTIPTVVTFSKAIDGRGLEWFAMDRTFLLVGAVAAFLAVALGAFGAHGLRGRLSPEMLGVFQTGVQYHMYHALALILVAGIMGRMSGWLIQTAGWCFAAGVLLFSRSLFLLSITRVTVLRAGTPIGGPLFLIWWGCPGVAGNFVFPRVL